jgi:hypothetical protein
MSTPDVTGRLGLEPWQVGDLRLTAFPSLAAPIEARTRGKRWEALVGKRPETAISHNFDTVVEESGLIVLGGKLTYRCSPRAIEWTLERVPSSDKPEVSFLSPQVLAPFKELMCRWLIDCPSLQRLALGAALYLMVKDRREAYERLEHLLHLGLKYSDDEGDFVYQYNRRRISQCVPEIKINRLSKWTWVPLGEVRVREGKLLLPAESACLLELDVNTMPEFQGTLPQDRYVPLFEEMMGLAVEIAAQGDVP